MISDLTLVYSQILGDGKEVLSQHLLQQTKNAKDNMGNKDFQHTQ